MTCFKLQMGAGLNQGMADMDDDLFTRMVSYLLYLVDQQDKANLARFEDAIYSRREYNTITTFYTCVIRDDSWEYIVELCCQWQRVSSLSSDDDDPHVIPRESPSARRTHDDYLPVQPRDRVGRYVRLRRQD